MDLGLTGKAVLVTASSRGIGKACALTLAGEGAHVAICARGGAALDALLAALGGPLAGHVAVACDLEADDGPGRLVAALADAAFVPDVVVHNAGGTLGVREIFPSSEAWRRVFRLNLEIALELNAALVPAMCARGWGRVIALGSIAGLEHQGALAYASAKAALVAYTRGLGRELAASGVVVSAVLPGTVRTEHGIWDVRARTTPEAAERYVAERLPAGDFQTPESIADVVAFLASERASQFIGSAVVVDGGQGRFFGHA